jgi:hypothetical protein
MEKENQKTLEDVVDAITTKETTIEIDIIARNRVYKWLQKRGWHPLKKKYVMRPLVIGNMYRISRLLVGINVNSDEAKKGLSLAIAHKMVVDHMDTMVEIVAIAIHNQRSLPGDQLKSELRDNLTAQDMMKLLLVMLHQSNLQAFIHSIISTAGLNVLDKNENPIDSNEVSPLIQER